MSRRYLAYYYLNFNIAAERHAELILYVLGEDSLKRLFEQRCVK